MHIYYTALTFICIALLTIHDLSSFIKKMHATTSQFLHVDTSLFASLSLKEYSEIKLILDKEP